MTNYEENKLLCKDAISIALSLGCRECKATISMGMENCIELRDGELDQINSSISCNLTLHLYVEGRYGVVSTNRIERDELCIFIKNSISNIRHLAIDEHRYLPDPSKYFDIRQCDLDLQNYDDNYERVSFDDKVAVAKQAYDEIVERAPELVSVSTMVDDNIVHTYMISSNGFEGEQKFSSFALSSSCYLKGIGDERPESSWYDYNVRWDKLTKDGIGTKCVERGLQKIGAKKVEAGSYCIIVENMVASKLLSPIIAAISGGAIQQEQSFLLEKLGVQVFSPLFTLIDNPAEIGNAGAQHYDSDGMALHKRTIIEKGVLKEYYVSQYISRKLGCEATTGSASVLKFPDSNINLEDIISNQSKALFITGFNGGNCNGTTGNFSYGIEGFLIENGKITKPFAEMVMTGNMIELWCNLSEIASDARINSSWQMPSLLFNNIIIS